jgi:hypothetical protein
MVRIENSLHPIATKERKFSLNRFWGHKSCHYCVNTLGSECVSSHIPQMRPQPWLTSWLQSSEEGWRELSCETMPRFTALRN